MTINILKVILKIHSYMYDDYSYNHVAYCPFGLKMLYVVKLPKIIRFVNIQKEIFNCGDGEEGRDTHKHTKKSSQKKHFEPIL